jgi:hypothetical protein
MYGYKMGRTCGLHCRLYPNFGAIFHNLIGRSSLLSLLYPSVCGTYLSHSKGIINLGVQGTPGAHLCNSLGMPLWSVVAEWLDVGLSTRGSWVLWTGHLKIQFWIAIISRIACGTPNLGIKKRFQGLILDTSTNVGSTFVGVSRPDPRHCQDLLWVCV